MYHLIFHNEIIFNVIIHDEISKKAKKLQEFEFQLFTHTADILKRNFVCRTSK